MTRTPRPYRDVAREAFEFARRLTGCLVEYAVQTGDDTGIRLAREQALVVIEARGEWLAAGREFDARLLLFHGEQTHMPDGTGVGWVLARAAATAICEAASERGEAAWAWVLLGQAYEALAEADPDRLRTELVQVAAVALRWVHAIDTRGDSAMGGAR